MSDQDFGTFLFRVAGGEVEMIAFRVVRFVALMGCCASLADAQTALHTQATDESDICAGISEPMDASDMDSCGFNNYANHNYANALKWYLKAASNGSYLAQFQLAEMYENGEGGPQDFVQAYKWFDIAAATHGAYIDQLPAVSSPAPESNQMEINYRDDVAKKMNTIQIAQAQKEAREWLSRMAPRKGP